MKEPTLYDLKKVMDKMKKKSGRDIFIKGKPKHKGIKLGS